MDSLYRDLCLIIVGPGDDSEEGLGFRAQGLGLRGLGFRVSGFGFRC